MSESEIGREDDFDGTAYELIRRVSRIEDQADDVLAKELCHDAADYQEMRSLVFAGSHFPFEQRKRVLSTLLKKRHPQVWDKVRKCFEGKEHYIDKLQKLRNNLAHRDWIVDPGPDEVRYDSETGAEMTWPTVGLAGTYAKTGFRYEELSFADLERGIEIAKEVESAFVFISRELIEKRQKMNVIKPVDRMIELVTSVKKFDWS